jgi:hypothetical protein
MMTPEEAIEKHDQLSAKISDLMWEFADNNSEDSKEKLHQAFFIIQAVLTKCSSAVEYQVAKMAPLTDRQIDHICYQIGEWYMMMKPLLEGQHNLGYMKEKLKTMICGE